MRLLVSFAIIAGTFGMGGGFRPTTEVLPTPLNRRMKMYPYLLVASPFRLAWLLPNIPIAKQCRRLAPRITSSIAASMELKPRPSAFVWTAQGKGSPRRAWMR
jgi:hypothetical protein